MTRNTFGKDIDMGPRPEGIPDTSTGWDPDGNWRDKDGYWSDGGTDMHQGGTVNGRSKGFRKGWSGGPGSPNTGRIAADLRKALMEVVDAEDIRQIACVLKGKAKSGNLEAIKLLFDRVLGPANALDLIERLEKLETQADVEREIDGAFKLTA
jgi:hypothetical protein